MTQSAASTEAVPAIEVSPSLPTRSKIVTEFDVLRCAATMLVMISHLRNLYYVDYPQVASQNIAIKGMYFVSGLGHQAVMIFFVLSGLLVGGSVISGIGRGNWSLTKYLIARLSRLCIVLWPALLLTFLLNALGNFLFDFSNLYHSSQIGSNVISHHFIKSSSLGTYFANAFFLQGSFFLTVGTNGPLWSLANEFWYYLIFPFLITVLVPGVSLRARVASIVGLLVCAYVFKQGNFLSGFIVWLTGVACVLVAKRWRWHGGKTFVWAGLVMLVGTLSLSRLELLAGNDNIVIAISTGVLCFGVLLVPNQIRGPIRKVSHFFANFSYTLFLTHLPFLIFIRGSFLDSPRWQPGLLSISYGVALCIATIIWAYLIYRVTEYYSPDLRKFLTKKLYHPATTTSNPLRKAAHFPGS